MNNDEYIDNMSNDAVDDIHIKSGIDDIESLRKTFTTQGLSGLINIGNTCYMNSALQCLSATDILITYFIGKNNSNNFETDLKTSIVMRHDKQTDLTKEEIKKQFKDSMTYDLRKLLYVMWGTNCKIRPINFKKKLGDMKSIFEGSSQNDSQECLSFILDQVHEETKTDIQIEIEVPENIQEFIDIKRQFNKIINDTNSSDDDKIKSKDEYNKYVLSHLKEHLACNGILYWTSFLKKNHSTIIDIFTGLYLTETICQNCNNHSFKFDAYNILSVSIPDGNNINIEQCFQSNFNYDESLIGDNQYECDGCAGKHDAIKNLSLFYTPPRLIIQLKRFVNSKRGTKKIDELVKFPITGLNLKNCVNKYNTSDHIYDLYGVINHSGGLKGGHYVAYTKNPINDEWYLFDDSNVLHIDKNKIENKIITSDAYVLFYKKR